MQMLQCMQYPLPEQRETGSAVALSFDEFQLVDLPPYLAV